MRQSFDRSGVRTWGGRSLFPGSSPGHSTARTIPPADRCSVPPNIIPATVSTGALPLRISAALRSDRHDCVLFLELTPCAGLAANVGITRTQMGAGQRYFCRFHIYVASAPAGERRELVANQPGTRQRYCPCEFDRGFPDAGLFYSWVAVWTCGCGDCFFGHRPPDKAANLILYRRTARSCDHFRLVDEILAAFASLAGDVCRDLVDARNGRGLPSTDATTHLRASGAPCRRYLHL